MKRIKRIKKLLRSGDSIELTKQVNCIPAGVYTFKSKDIGGYYLGIGKGIVIYLSSDCKNFLRAAPGKKHLSEDQYLEAYSLLLGKNPSAAHDPSRPFTLCFVNDYAQGKINSLVAH
ncbi:hypothetical protein JNK13_06310 [bacterium]|nr:hypothetical protein [bacterium]